MSDIAGIKEELNEGSDLGSNDGGRFDDAENRTYVTALHDESKAKKKYK